MADSSLLVHPLPQTQIASRALAEGTRAMLHSTILVVAKDRFIASLLGGLIELSGRIVAYKSDDEGCDSAVRRTHPELVMFDCALGIAACSEIAAVARVEGSRLLMFSASHTDREARDIASLYGAQCFVLPIKPREFMESLDRAIGTTAFQS